MDTHVILDPKTGNYWPLDHNADEKSCLWLLYTPEQLQEKDPNLYLWVRRCELFTSQAAIHKHLKYTLYINILKWERHELFPELLVGTDKRGFKWYVEKAPIHV